MKQLLFITLILLSLATFAQDGGADQFKLRTNHLQIDNLQEITPVTVKTLIADENGNVGYTTSAGTGGDGLWTNNGGYISYNKLLGDVRIGEPADTLDLYVSRRIYTTEVFVRTAVPAPDYVFDENYELTKLEELEKYLEEHKHLPEIPSAKEIEANGINVSEMNMLLLKKVEELTLYVINQQKEIDALKRQADKKEAVKE